MALWVAAVLACSAVQRTPTVLSLLLLARARSLFPHSRSFRLFFFCPPHAVQPQEFVVQSDGQLSTLKALQ